MKIGIIGFGFVGKAVAHSHRNQELVIRDPILQDKSASIDEIKSCDAIYVCVPTPMLDDGHCDDSYIKSVLSEIKDFPKVIICKSTVPPGVYIRLEDQYPNIVHAPEFLTAANATNDYENSSWVLIGGKSPWIEQAEKVISMSTIKAKVYHRTTIQSAAFFKYLANSFLASKVIFLNEMYQLSKHLDINWKDIKEMGLNDPRLGTSHWDVPGPDGEFGYGGACFPKDVSAIIEHGLDIGTNLTLLQQVKETNKKFRQ